MFQHSYAICRVVYSDMSRSENQSDQDSLFTIMLRL